MFLKKQMLSIISSFNGVLKTYDFVQTKIYHFATFEGRQTCNVIRTPLKSRPNNV